MRILADANMPFAAEAFAPFGEVTLMPGRSITRADAERADVLMVRSVTRVDAALLDGTPVRFVGTATIGTDHLDNRWLESHGIRWTSAAGCNARSVVEWVLAALAEYCLSIRVDWRDLTLGIVGHGNIGSRLTPVARGLGMRVLVNDPPLARAGLLDDHVPLDELLAQSDAVTLHVPYTREGADPTHHLIGRAELARMKPAAALLNSSRGAVLDNEAAMTFARAEAVVFLLDVFEGEPRPARELVRQSFLATPHIAGYSWEGKVNGTRMMAEALAQHLGTDSTWRPPAEPPPGAEFALEARTPMQAFHEAIRHSYRILDDDRRLREGAGIEDDAAWGAHFDELRRGYPVRREFANYTVLNVDLDGRVRTGLHALGFQLSGL